MATAWAGASAGANKLNNLPAVFRLTSQAAALFGGNPYSGKEILALVCGMISVAPPAKN
jgi:hypothetical protein